MHTIQRDMVSLVPRLRRYARGLTNNVDRADDLVQDCLERALGRIHLWEEGTNLQAWMFTIMHNIFINDCRKRKSIDVPIDDFGDIPDFSDPPDQGMFSSQVMTMITTLPPSQREVLLLVAVEGVSYAEVAQILDVPIGTVMSRLHRAREALRNAIDGSKKATIRRVK